MVERSGRCGEQLVVPGHSVSCSHGTPSLELPPVIVVVVVVGPLVAPGSPASVTSPLTPGALVIVPAVNPDEPAESPQPTVNVTARTDMSAAERSIAFDDMRALRRTATRDWASPGLFAKLGPCA
jgi:hypothetical protein